MNEKIQNWRDRLVFFTLGVLSLAVVGLLLGAASDHQNSTLNFGRYQLSSWATQLDSNSGIVGAFVMDTVSGETRTAFIRTYGDTPPKLTEKYDLKKTFHKIR